MKNIAVFTYNFITEYATSVVKGIFSYFESVPDVRVFYMQTRRPGATTNFFEYQYWAATEIAKSDFIDAVILVSNSYTFYYSKEKIRELMTPFFNKTFVSVGMDFFDKNIASTNTSCLKSFDEIVGHLKNVHSCKKIAFFSANPIGSEEAFERYDAFKTALKNHNLEFDEKRVFNGYFTSSSAQKELREKIKSKDQIDFDALICANDLMAVGSVDFFSEMGLVIPRDLKIIGFDNTSHAALCNPALTTIDPAISHQGYDASALVMRILSGEKCERNIMTPLRVFYRHSCGCDNVVTEKNMDKFRSYLSYYEDISKIDFLFDFVRGASTLQEFADSFKKIGPRVGVFSLVVCMYDEPFCVASDEKYVMKDEIRLVMNLNIDSDVSEVSDDGEVFNPNKNLIPPSIMNKNDDAKGQFVLNPIFLGEKQYGYLICRMTNTDFALNGVLLKLFVSTLAQAYDYTKTVRRAKKLESTNQNLMDTNSSLKVKSRTDELTSLLNRRGFMESGQRLISIAVEIDMTGVVFFADLDGLKKINDTFGHEYGDIAIKLQAKILREAFRSSDTVGRLSGDEFAIISTGMHYDFVEKMRQKIDALDEHYTKSENLPFKLSISLGAAEFSEKKSDLAELLKEADANLYEQKTIHHARNAAS